MGGLVHCDILIRLIGMILNAIGSRVWRGTETAPMSSRERLATAHYLMRFNTLGAEENLPTLVLLVEAGMVERNILGPDALPG